MQIEEVLGKITERNAPVVGCIARKGNKLYHNLDDFGLECEEIVDKVNDLLSISDLLDGGESEVDTVIAEFDGHNLIGQRIDDSILVTVADHLQRAGLKKLQVGLSLQSRMLSKALDAAPDNKTPNETLGAIKAKEATAKVAEDDKKKSTWGNLMNAVIAQAPEAPEATDANTEGKVRRIYRGQVFYE